MNTWSSKCLSLNKKHTVILKMSTSKRILQNSSKSSIPKKLKKTSTLPAQHNDCNKSNLKIRPEQNQIPEKIDMEDLGISTNIWKPANWERTLENIREMRKNKDAPVDSMGCDKCIDYNCSPEIMRFHALVSLMLSSQTKDEVTFAAMERLKNYKFGLNIDSIINMSEETLGTLIYPVGFWKRKTKYLKETAKILKEKFYGDIPNTVDLLCTLPGVGQKMAHICMKTAWNIISGIGVDTHVHRISNRIGWVAKPTKTPEQTRVALESWLPKNLWEEVNNLLVGFGQQTCKPVKPLCNTCANQSICPYALKSKSMY